MGPDQGLGLGIQIGETLDELCSFWNSLRIYPIAMNRRAKTYHTLLENLMHTPFSDHGASEGLLTEWKDDSSHDLLEVPSILDDLATLMSAIGGNLRGKRDTNNFVSELWNVVNHGYQEAVSFGRPRVTRAEARLLDQGPWAW